MLKIDSTALKDLIYILESYLKRIAASTVVGENSYFSEIKQQSIIERYMKGVNIADLAMQFDCRKEIIELIIKSRDLPFVDNTMPKAIRKKYYRRRKN